MPLISSTVNKVLVVAIAFFLVLSVTFGGLYAYRGTVIADQELTMATQKSALDSYAKDKAAQSKADKQLAKDKAAIIKQRDDFKKRLSDALKGNKCDNEPLPDDAKRVLDELYNSQGS